MDKPRVQSAITSAPNEGVVIHMSLCHFRNPDLAFFYEPGERVCRRRDGHPGPHAGIIGRSRWIYPTPGTILPVNNATAEELILEMDRLGV